MWIDLQPIRATKPGTHQQQLSWLLMTIPQRRSHRANDCVWSDRGQVFWKSMGGGPDPYAYAYRANEQICCECTQSEARGDRCKRGFLDCSGHTYLTLLLLQSLQADNAGRFILTQRGLLLLGFLNLLWVFFESLCFYSSLGLSLCFLAFASLLLLFQCIFNSCQNHSYSLYCLFPAFGKGQLFDVFCV